MYLPNNMLYNISNKITWIYFSFDL